jgi:spermidine synthase
MDGRWFVMNCTERYDVIFLDAYNDLSIPYHLTTKEFAKLLRGILTPGGIILTNIIDDFRKGAFLPSYVKTLQEVFGAQNVHIVSISPDFENIGISTFIVLAGNVSLDIASFESFMRQRKGRALTSAVVPEDTVRNFLAKRDAITLIDDHVPVDNLIAPIFEERFGYNRRNR